ncbi:unnamed protein product [Pylaiella littoralis]
MAFVSSLGTARSTASGTVPNFHSSHVGVTDSTVAAVAAAAGGRWTAATRALPRWQQRRWRRRRRVSVGLLRCESSSALDNPVGPSSTRSGDAAPATARRARTVGMIQGGALSRGSDSGSGSGHLDSKPTTSSDGVTLRTPPREASSAVRLPAHRSSSVATEARLGILGRVGTRLDRPSGGRGRNASYGSGSDSGKPRAGKKERATKVTPPDITDWRNGKLDGKSRSFLFVKEIKAIPKWNGAKVMRVLKEARQLSTVAAAPQPGAKKLEMTSFMYNACISHMSRCGRWEEALQVLDLMRTWKVPQDEFCVTAAITACGRAGQWQKSLDLLERLREDDGPTTVRLMNAVVDACRKGRQWEKALEMLADMKEHGVTPDEFTYSAAIAACRQGRQWDKALELFREMPQVGVRLTAVHYNVAIAICGEGKQPEKAYELFREMQTAGNGTRYKMNRVSYNTAMIACGEGGSWELALELFRDMAHPSSPPSSSPSPSSSSSAAAAAATSPRPAATATADERGRGGVAPDLISYNTIIDVCKKCGRWKEAVKILREMDTPGGGAEGSGGDGDGGGGDGGGGGGGGGIVPNVVTYTSAFVACGKSGRWDEALALFREMKQVGIKPDVISYNTAISASGEAGRWQDGLALLVEMPGEGVKPDHTSYSTAILLCGRCGQLEAGLGVLRNIIPAHGATANVLNYSAASVVCAVCKDWEKVLGVFEEMREKRISPNAACLTDLVVVSAKTGQWEELLEALKKLVEAGDIISSKDLEVITKTAVAAARNCGKDEAEQLRLAEVLSLASPQQASTAVVAASSNSTQKGE